MTSEHERQSKLAARKRTLKTNSPASVSSVTTAEEKPTTDSKSQQNKTKQDTLRASIEALRSDFVQFKQSLNPGEAKPQHRQHDPRQHASLVRKQTIQRNVTIALFADQMNTLLEVARRGQQGRETGGSYAIGTTCS